MPICYSGKRWSQHSCRSYFLFLSILSIILFTFTFWNLISFCMSWMLFDFRLFGFTLTISTFPLRLQYIGLCPMVVAFPFEWKLWELAKAFHYHHKPRTNPHLINWVHCSVVINVDWWQPQQLSTEYIIPIQQHCDQYNIISKFPHAA